MKKKDGSSNQMNALFQNSHSNSQYSHFPLVSQQNNQNKLLISMY